jgi:hypothetical protein
MMKKSNFFLYLIIGISLVLTVFGLLHYLKILQLPMNLFLIFFIVVPFLFLTGGVIATVGNYKTPDAFAQRFLLLTTFQFLMVLSILMAVWYKDFKYLKAFGFQFLSIFLVLMLIQSVLLIRLGSSRK